MRGLLAFLVLAAVVSAQEPWEEPQLGLERLEESLKTAKQRVDELPEAERGPWAQRAALLEELIGTLRSRAQLLDPAVVAERQAKAEEALKELRTRAPEPVPASLDKDALAALESAAKEAEAAAKAAQQAWEELAQRQKQLQEEMAGLPQRIAEAKRKLEDDDALTDVVRANLLLERRAAEERLEYEREALSRWSKRLPMLEAERDLARLRHERAKDRNARALARYAEQQQRAAQAERERAAADERAAQREQDPIERFRKQIQAETSRHEAARKAEAAFQAVLDQRLQLQESSVQRLKEERSRLAARFDGRAAGLSERAGEILQKTLQRLARNRDVIFRRHLPRLDQEIETYQATRGEAQDRLWELEAPLEENDVWAALEDSVPADRVEEARQVFQETVNGLVNVLRTRTQELTGIDGALSRLESLYRERITANDELRGFIRGKLYWVRSDAPIGAAVVGRAAGEVRAVARVLTDDAALAGAAEAYRRSPGTMWAVAGGFLVALVLWIVFLRRAARFAERWQFRGGPVLAATQRILVALLLAARLPVLLWGLSLLLRVPELPAVFEAPVVCALELFAVFWFARCVLQRFLRPDGIATANLGLAPPVAAQLLRSGKIATTSALLFLVPHQVLATIPVAAPDLSRLVYTGFLVGMTLALGLLLGRRGALVRALTGGAGFLHRAWLVVGPAATLGLLAIVVLDLVGYRRGAQFLMTSAIQSFVALLVLVGVYRLLRRLVERVAMRVHSHASAAEGQAAAWEQSRAVLNQLTRVIAAAILVAALFLLADFWDVGGPITAFFDQIHLTALSDGDFLTLWDVVVALLWITAGHFVVANLGGLYEFLVFPALGGTDKGGRYVWLALSRYAILLVVYSAALLTLHFSFSSIGWLLAAASVGLGFGLQEIVANFVSGLILLLERPIRVGDVISVGETGGTVERIMIRATVVTNWDRQQIIVPNKNFITQNLTNWTRNDEVIRRRVRVGAAYGTDVEKVLRVLTEVVQAHPKVVADPAPRIWFEDFGESSLDFEVWFFCLIADGKQAMTEIRTTIAKRFQEEGIEIPFPQRDLHIRSVDDSEALGALLERREVR